MTKKVKFYPRRIAEAITYPSYIISIGEPGHMATLHPNHKSVLKLEFHDIEQFIEGYKTFSISQARSIIQWLKDVPPEALVIVHCEAGISRSAAVAQFMIKDLDYELAPDRFCKGDFSGANGYVYGMLRQLNADKGVLAAAAEQEYYDRINGGPKW